MMRVALTAGLVAFLGAAAAAGEMTLDERIAAKEKLVREAPAIIEKYEQQAKDLEARGKDGKWHRLQAENHRKGTALQAAQLQDLKREKAAKDPLATARLDYDAAREMVKAAEKQLADAKAMLKETEERIRKLGGKVLDEEPR